MIAAGLVWTLFLWNAAFTGSYSVGASDIETIFREASKTLDWEKQVGLVSQLVATGDSAVPFLRRELLTGREAAGREPWFAAYILRQIGTSKAAEALIAGAEGAPDLVAKLRAIKALGELHCLGATAILTRLVRGPLGAPASYGADALALVNAEFAASVIVTRLGAPGGAWTESAIRARLQMLRTLRQVWGTVLNKTGAMAILRRLETSTVKAAKQLKGPSENMPRLIADLARLNEWPSNSGGSD